MSELTNYEKAMLIMQRAQVRLSLVDTSQLEPESAGIKAQQIVRTMDEQLGELCTAEVLNIVSPRRPGLRRG